VHVHGPRLDRPRRAWFTTGVGGLTELLGGPLATLGFGGAAGAVVGYTAKKLTKLAAILLGSLFILLQLLVYFGFVDVRWDAVQGTAQQVWTDADGVTLADKVWEVLAANLPFGGGFAAGFALGFKVG
jgi:uncharacterized membrane protein (Fun14 family)